MITKTFENAPRRRNRTLVTLTFHDKDEREAKRIVVTEKNVMLFLVAPIVIWLLLSGVFDELARSEHRSNINSLRPRMEALANQGHDEASLWVAKNYLSTNRDRIASLAAKEVPEAMYMHGVLLVSIGDKASGTQWIERAAARGNAAANRYVVGLKSDSQ